MAHFVCFHISYVCSISILNVCRNLFSKIFCYKVEINIFSMKLNKNCCWIIDFWIPRKSALVMAEKNWLNSIQRNVFEWAHLYTRGAIETTIDCCLHQHHFRQFSQYICMEKGRDVCKVKLKSVAVLVENSRINLLSNWVEFIECVYFVRIYNRISSDVSPHCTTKKRQQQSAKLICHWQKQHPLYTCCE